MDQCSSDSKNCTGRGRRVGERRGNGERKGKKSQSPLCWLCKSATSAAYFPPKHCSVEWSPQTGPFLIFVAMHYQAHWCMCALIAHSSTGCMRSLWEGSYSHTGCPMWQHDAVGIEMFHSQYMADTVAAKRAKEMDQNTYLACIQAFSDRNVEKNVKFYQKWKISQLTHNHK